MSEKDLRDIIAQVLTEMNVSDSAAAPAWAVLVFGAIIVQQVGVFYTGMSHGLLIDTDNWEGGARGMQMEQRQLPAVEGRHLGRGLETVPEP